MNSPNDVVKSWPVQGGLTQVQFWCPACEAVHQVKAGANGHDWNERSSTPTLYPAITHKRADGRVCHLEVTNGRIYFLDDSAHDMAGKSVTMVPLKKWK